MARPRRPAAPSPPRSAAPFAGDAASLVVMARLVGAFGVKGWVKVKPYTQAPEALGAFDAWIVRSGEGWREVPLEDFALHAKGPVAKLAGCEDRAAADALRGCDVAVPRRALGEPEEGTLYQVDLVGLEVVDEAGARLGTVEGLFEAGDASVMVVAGERERLIPFVPDYVKAVDREGGRITVDWKADYDA